VAGVVGALTEDDDIDSYRRRKRAHHEATLAIAALTGRPRLAREVADLLDALAERDARRAGA
jgi:hypothetical protein